jgi:hypothetical protein
MTLNLPEKIAKNERTPVPPLDQPSYPSIPKRGKLTLRHKTIAEYAARGYPPKMIAKIVGMKTDSVRDVLEKNELVGEYINQILSDLFQEGDMLLVNLYKKALVKLDSEMESPDADIRHKAIEKVLKQAMITAGKGGGEEGGSKTLIAQFFGGSQGSGGSGGIGVESMDEVILRKRKERGLEE